MYLISGVSARLFQHWYHFDIQLPFYVSSAVYNWSKWMYMIIMSRQENYSFFIEVPRFFLILLFFCSVQVLRVRFMQLNQQFKLAGNNFVVCCFFSFVLLWVFYACVCLLIREILIIILQEKGDSSLQCLGNEQIKAVQCNSCGWTW